MHVRYRVIRGVLVRGMRNIILADIIGTIRRTGQAEGFSGRETALQKCTSGIRFGLVGNGHK